MAKTRVSHSIRAKGGPKETKAASTFTKKTRVQLDAEQKAEILKQHLFHKVPIADLCAQYKLQPSVIYYWQKQTQNNLAAALAPRHDARQRTRRERELMARIAVLESTLDKKNAFIAAISKDYVAQKKKHWGPLEGRWVPPHVRDEVVEFVAEWSKKTDLPVNRLVKWLNISKGKFYQWRKKQRSSKVAAQGGKKPRAHWLHAEERQAIVDYYLQHPHVDYRRLTYMMLDNDIAAVSASTTYRVLRTAGVLKRPPSRSWRKRRQIPRSDAPHRHWHIDIVRLDVAGSRHYLYTILDSYSRAFVHWDIRGQMTEHDIEQVVQQAVEQLGVKRPELGGTTLRPHHMTWFLGMIGLPHAQARFYDRLFTDLRAGREFSAKTIGSIQEAHAMVAELIHYYNHVRLHSGIGYVAPSDRLNGRDEAVWERRNQKLEEARAQRCLLADEQRVAA